MNLADRAKQELVNQARRAESEAQAVIDECKANFEEYARRALQLVAQRWCERMGVESVPVSADFGQFHYSEDYDLNAASYTLGYFTVEGRQYQINLRMHGDGMPRPADNKGSAWHLVDEFDASVSMRLTPSYYDANRPPLEGWRPCTTLAELGEAFEEDEKIKKRNKAKGFTP